MADFKNILLKAIQPDPNQPRKFFDENDLQELTDSVRVNGILQPILVRPAGKDKYTLVCGERRYRAAVAVMTAIKDRNTIPAVIRDLTDEQALELQIVENLQRKDVHPMEEAVAFKSLLDHKQLDVSEIAARVGKSVFYVRQRLKLNDLNEAWQKAFFANHVNLKGAMGICQLAESSQDALYKSKQVDRCHPGAWVTVELWDINNYRGYLTQAPFDLEDHMLLPGKGGACTNCQHNSAVSLLFPEEDKSPRCMNISCFEAKIEAHMKRETAIAIDDPAIVLVSDRHQLGERSKKLQKNGLVVYNNNEYSAVQEPERPDLLELREQYEDELEEGEKTEADIQQEYKELLAQFEKERASYEQKVAGGKFKKAFVVEGNSKAGHYIYVTIKGKGDTKSAKAAIQSGQDVTTADIDAEITRLKDREKRNKELDAEKVQARVAAELSNHSGFYESVGAFSDSEFVALGVLLYDASDYTAREWLEKKLKTGSDWDMLKVYKKLVSLPPDEMTNIVRRLVRRSILGKLITANSRPEKYGKAAAIRQLAEDYVPAMVKIFDQEQADVTFKRVRRVNARIDELQKQKSDLTASSLNKTKS